MQQNKSIGFITTLYINGKATKVNVINITWVKKEKFMLIRLANKNESFWINSQNKPCPNPYMM